MDLAYLKSYDFDSDNCVLSRENRNRTFCDNYFLKLIADWNKSLDKSHQLIKQTFRKNELQFSLNGRTFLEVYYGSKKNNELPYFALGYAYERVLQANNVYQLVKLIKSQKKDLIKYITDYKETNEKECDDLYCMKIGVKESNYTPLNQHALANINERMLNYVESITGMLIKDFWKDKQNLIKIYNAADKFCAAFLHSNTSHLYDIIKYTMHDHQDTTGYIIYLMIAKRYSIRLETGDYEIIAKKFNQPVAFIQQYYPANYGF